MKCISEQHFLWDFWFVTPQEWLDDSLYQLFYLQAPRTLSTPNLRHGVSTVGHAVTQIDPESLWIAKTHA